MPRSCRSPASQVITGDPAAGPGVEPLPAPISSASTPRGCRASSQASCWSHRRRRSHTSRGPARKISAELATVDGVRGPSRRRSTDSSSSRYGDRRRRARPRSSRCSRSARTSSLPHPLGVRVDGYWLVPWLRAEGAELSPAASPTADPRAREVRGAVRLARRGAAQRWLPRRPTSSGAGAHGSSRTGSQGRGSSAAFATATRSRMSALEHASRGGQLLVVPACASDPPRPGDSQPS